MQHSHIIKEIEKFLSITDQLEALLVHEMDIVNQKNEVQLGELQEQKEILTRNYAAQMEVIKRFGDAVKTLDQSIRSRLIERTLRLQETSELNEKILKAALDEKQSVILMLLDLVRNQQRKLNSYGISGTVIASNKVYADKFMPLSMDRRL